METISNEALAAARAKLDAAESRRENILLFHIANGVNIESRTVQIDNMETFRSLILPPSGHFQRLRRQYTAPCYPVRQLIDASAI